VRNVDPAAGLAFAADGATVAAGAFNAAWLFAYRPHTALPPRPGAGPANPSAGFSAHSSTLDERTAGFPARPSTPGLRTGRSFAALTLAVLNAGVALQAAFAQALYTGHHWGLQADPLFAPGPWLASRALVLAGTLALSFLILRKAAR
jgi:hypothetical protein